MTKFDRRNTMFYQLAIHSNTYSGFTWEGQIHFKEFIPADPSSVMEVDQTVKQSFNYLKQILAGGE